MTGQSSLNQGTVIAGRYTLRELIGQGGHGEVWKARDSRESTYVAVKILNDVAAKDPQITERLKREQQALVQLAGTSAVRVIDLCRAPGARMCLVLELLEGIDLEQHLERLDEHGERMPIPDLVAILDPIVATLERAHQAGILHRDLKPANVFLLASGGVRLLDFGLARLRRAQPLTAVGMVLGSPSYIAPEVWVSSAKGVDHRCDIYSLGVIVFRALSGRVPFEGNLQEKFIATTTAPRPSLRKLRPDLSRDIDAWVEEVLAIDPDQRFNTIRGAWTALLAVLRVPELAQRLVTEEDMASVGASQSPFGVPFSTQGSAPPPPARLPPQRQGVIGPVRAAAKAVQRWANEEHKPDAGEQSVWLSPDEFSEDANRPAPVFRKPPPPPRAKPAAAFEPIKPPQRAPFDGPADDKRSFVSEWLVGSDLRPAQPAAESEDVMQWLGGPSKDGTTTAQMKAVKLPPEPVRPVEPPKAPFAKSPKKTIRSFTPVPEDDDDDIKAIFSIPDEELDAIFNADEPSPKRKK